MIRDLQNHESQRATPIGSTVERSIPVANPPRRRRSIVLRVACAAAMAVIGAVAPAANAVVVEGTNSVFQLDGGIADFGGGRHDGTAPIGLAGAAAGSPASVVRAATVTWDYSTINQQVVAKARVRGVLYLNTLGSGRAVVVIDFKRRDGSVLASRLFETGFRQGGDPNLAVNQRLVEAELQHPELHVVTVRTATLPRIALTSSFSTTATRHAIAPVVSKHLDTISVRHGHADFGSGRHESGGPMEDATITFTRTDGSMKANVRGTLYWDHAIFGTARLIVEFCGPDGQLITPARTINLNGIGVSANLSENKKGVNETFESGNLVFVRLRIGEIVNGAFEELPPRLYRFQ